MHVVIGSENPVKIAAVDSALERFDPVVTTVGVDSGVAEQPRGVAETVTGAETRARRALRTVDGAEARIGPEAHSTDRAGAFGVGLEGGVARLDSPGLWLVMWAAVTDGRRLERGAGPSLRLPRRVAERVDAGDPLGPVMDDLLGTTGVAERDGAAGVLTDGLTDRQGALEAAVACAFGPFLTELYDA